MAVGEGLSVLVAGAVGDSEGGVSVVSKVGVRVWVGMVLGLGLGVWVGPALGLGVEDGMLVSVAVALSGSAVGLDVGRAVEVGPTVRLGVSAETSVGVVIAAGDVAWGVSPRSGVDVAVSGTLGAGVDAGPSPNTKNARSRTPTTAAPRTPYTRNRRPLVSSALDRAFSR